MKGSIVSILGSGFWSSEVTFPGTWNRKKYTRAGTFIRQRWDDHHDGSDMN